MRNKLIALTVLLATACMMIKYRSALGREWLYWTRPSASAARAFYFWKSRWAPTGAEISALNELKIGRVYFRFFDVERDKSTGSPRPVGELRFESPAPKNIEAIPVVYIKNEVFLYESNPAELADRVWNKVAQMARDGGFAFKETQIDCDWSVKSRAAFFIFLESYKAKAKAFGASLSATVRLHQIKYRSITGLPPVDRGMLMFYNMGKIEASGSQLSIYNSADARTYARSIDAYPLHLDLALPIFSWVVHSRDGRLLGLIDKLDTQELESNPSFRASGEPPKDGSPGYLAGHLAGHLYEAQSSFFLHGLYLKSGDLLSVEQVTPEIAREAADLAALSSRGREPFQTVAFFDLNERNLKRYEKSKLEGIYRLFR